MAEQEPKNTHFYAYVGVKSAGVEQHGRGWAYMPNGPTKDIINELEHFITDVMKLEWAVINFVTKIE